MRGWVVYSTLILSRIKIGISFWIHIQIDKELTKMVGVDRA